MSASGVGDFVRVWKSLDLEPTELHVLADLLGFAVPDPTAWTRSPQAPDDCPR